MSFWSDMEDRSIGESIRTEDEILTKERLVEVLKSITDETEQQENSDVLSGELIKVMK